jgi:hypothetical protein
MQQPEPFVPRRYRAKIDRIGVQIGFIPTLRPFSASDSFAICSPRYRDVMSRTWHRVGRSRCRPPGTKQEGNRLKFPAKPPFG